MNNATLYILDEPCSGLDIVSRSNILDYIRSLAADPKITVIYVTHYADEMLVEFEHTVLMRKGCLYKVGETSNTLTNEILKQFLQADLQVDWRQGHLQICFNRRES